MVIVDPYGIYQGGIGKDVPTLGRQFGFSPKLASPGGRFGGIISGGIQIGRHVARHYRKYTKGAAAAAGYGVANYAPSNQFGQTYSTVQQRRRIKYKRRSTRNDRCCCKVHSKNQHRRGRRR